MGVGDRQGTEPRQAVVVTALGITQIFAWGCSYYLPAVLAKPITAGTGWPLAWVVGGLSLGLVAAGLASPSVGRAIQDYGGRAVLATCGDIGDFRRLGHSVYARVADLKGRVCLADLLHGSVRSWIDAGQVLDLIKAALQAALQKLRRCRYFRLAA